MSHQAFTVSRVVNFSPARRAGDRTVVLQQPSIETDAAAIHLCEGGDKYALDAEHAPIDCAARLSLCHAACCRLGVPLTRQDLDEGVVRWDRDQPYLNQRQPDGYCVHCDEDSRCCTIYAYRPGLCRTYDCRRDGRIWVDFDGRIPAPSLAGVTHEVAAPVRRATEDHGSA
jgi:Fe-S-cluster containining protein